MTDFAAGDGLARRSPGKPHWSWSAPRLAPRLLATALCLAAGPGMSDAVYISTYGTPTVPGWNRVTFNTKGAYSNMVDRTGFPVPVVIDVATNFTSGATHGHATPSPVGDAAEFAPAGTSQVYSRYNVVDAFVRGLLPGASYDFTFYASYMDTTSTFETLYLAQGATVGSNALTVAKNTNGVARVRGIVADAGGTVRLSICKGPNNTGQYFYLLAMKIEGVYNVDRFVSAAGGDDAAGGYTNWAGAATTLQAAIDRSVRGDTVWVENGFVTDTGGRTNWPAGAVLTNRVVIDKAVVVRSVSGDTNNMPVIVGAWDPSAIYGTGPNSARCVYLATHARLVGFLLTNGATRASIYTDPDSQGGGVRGESQTTSVVSNCVVVGCSASVGGGAYNCHVYGSTLITNLALSGTGDYRGGGGASLCSLYNSLLTRNRAAQGGGIYNGSRIYSSAIISNSSPSYGGGIRGNFVISNCLVMGNSGVSGGVTGGTLYDSTLIGNVGFAGYYGGGANGSTLYNCQVISNVCYNRGGGVYGGTLYNCRLVANRSGSYGGGAGDATLYNSLLVGNSTSGNNHGGGAGGGKLINCTLTGNAAGGDGGGASGSTMTNCISWGNNKPDANCAAFYSCGIGYTNGGAIVGNLAADPLLLNTNAGLYRLRGNSPCINQGVNLDWMTNAALVISRDLSGDRRLRDDRVDMGAYEFRAFGTRFFVR